jgi:hypothetical protein
MTKSKLKTGMVVTLRDGNKHQVYINAVTSLSPDGHNFLTNGCIWHDLESYNEDLTNIFDKKWDIVMVQYVDRTVMVYSGMNNANEVVWKREEPKKMTVAEIEAILGYKVEIVSEQ